jgi:hypothetical protein
MEFGHDDNLFLLSSELPPEGRVATGVVIIKPRFVMDLPFGSNRVRWAYSPLYRDYTSQQFVQSEKLSHYFDFDGLFRAGRAITVRAQDHYVRGTVELQEIDQGGELTFGLAPFTLNEASAEFDVDVTGRQGLSMIPRYATSSFDQVSGSYLLGYTRREFEGRYRYQLTPATQLYGYYAYENSAQERTPLLYGQVVITVRRAGLALSRNINRAVVASMAAGYETMRFEGGGPSQFDGWTLEANCSLQVGDVTRLDLSARRLPYPSYFVNSNYYLGDQIGMQLVRQVGQRVLLRFGATLSKNDYDAPLDITVAPGAPPEADLNMNGLVDAYESYAPSIGQTRGDKFVRFEAGVSLQMSPAMRLSVGYNVDRRNSNVEQIGSDGLFDPFDFAAHRLLVRIETGWM